MQHKLSYDQRKTDCLTDKNGNHHQKGNSSYKRLDIQTIQCLEHDVVIFFPNNYFETGQVIVEDWKVFKKEIQKRQKRNANYLMKINNA